MITKARLVIALIAVAVAGVAVSAVLLLGGPPYPHPWCGPLLTGCTTRAARNRHTRQR